MAYKLSCFILVSVALAVTGCDKAKSVVENTQVASEQARTETISAQNTTNSDKSLEKLVVDTEVIDALEEADQALKNVGNILKNKYHKTPILGIIDKAFYKKILTLIPEDNVDLLVFSSGGEVFNALNSARLILESRHNIAIIGMCASACAEYLLPAAAKVEFIAKPLIGFHGNSISNTHFAVKYDLKNQGQCDWRINQNKRMQDMYRQKGLNIDFWKTQYEHLDFISAAVKENPMSFSSILKKYDVENKDISPETCLQADVRTKHNMWFPTSKQLREDFGLKFTGEVCADDYECYAKRLTAISADGASYAVGDTVYVVKKSMDEKAEK